MCLDIDDTAFSALYKSGLPSFTGVQPDMVETVRTKLDTLKID